MASNPSAQLGFLTDAAHLLAITSPETSAYLLRRRNDLVISHGLELSDVHRQHVCTSCGHIMMIGQGSKLKLETQRALHKKTRRQPTTRQPTTRQPAASSGPSKVFSCAKCSCETRVIMPLPPPIVRKKPIQPTTAASDPVRSSYSGRGEAVC